MKIKCKKCGSIVDGCGPNFPGITWCDCGEIALDENEFYCNIIGNSESIDYMGSYNIENNTNRPSKINYYLDIAESVLERSTCLHKKYGAIIVKNDEIISSGYNGAPRGLKSCLDLKYCMRENSPRGMDYSMCSSVHAEQNAIISASRRDMIDSDLFLVGKEIIDSKNSYIENPAPCSICKRMIINAGIKNIYVRLNSSKYNIIPVDSWKLSDIIGGY